MSDDYAFSDGYDAAYDSLYEERRELEKKIEELEQKLEWNYRRLAGMETREKTFLAIINHLDAQRYEFFEKAKELQATVDMWESHVCGS